MSELSQTYRPETRVRDDRAERAQIDSTARFFAEAYDIPHLSRRNFAEERSLTRSEAVTNTLNTGNIWQTLGIEANTLAARGATPEPNSRHPNRNSPEQMIRSESISIRGVGAQRDTLAHIAYDSNGIARRFRDHFGDWQSHDGTTWRLGDVKNGDGPHGIRRGEVSIQNGSLVFRDSDFGVTTTIDQNRQTTRSISTTTGQQYSVTRNERGEPAEFSDSNGTWRRTSEYVRDGRNEWINNSGRVVDGDVSLTPYGEFRFTETTQDGRRLQTRVAQTAQNIEIRAEQASITRDFGLRFAAPGQQTIDSEGITFVNGAPSLSDLSTLRRVLTQNPQVSFRDVTMYFAASSFEATSHYGQYGPTRPVLQRGDLQSPHACGPGCSHNENIIRTQGSMIIMPRARMFMEGMNSLEGTLGHELDHLEQGQFFGHGNDAWGVRQQRTRAIEAISNAMGWTLSTFRSNPNPASNNQQHETRAVLRDRQGQYWAQESEDSWRRVVGVLNRGRLINAAFVNESRRLNDSQMREQAAIRPSTLYFPSPDEMSSEAFAMYRMSISRPGDNRRALMFHSPELYRITQNEDQRRLDTRLGVDPITRESLYIRNLDGMVVRNTPEIRQSIHQQEAIWRAEAQIKERQARMEASQRNRPHR